MRILLLLVLAATTLLVSLSVMPETTAAAGPEEALTSSAELIGRDIEAGLIAPELGVILEAIAAIRPDSLPARYKTTALSLPLVGKCATDLVTQAILIIDADLKTYGSYRSILAARPSAQTYIDSYGGYFRLHYDTTGSHAVPTEDSNSNGIPDYIDRAMEIADSVWRHQVDNLGYLPPISDGTQGGGVGFYDIYFQAIPYYGFTTPETPGPYPWNDYSSYITVHRSFGPPFPPNEDPEGDVIGALKVTIAHEFFHAVQFSYDAGEASHFMESSSTWMEEVCYPEVNDNYNYLPYFYDVPQEGLQAGDVHRYASFVWPKFLEESYGIDIIRSIWWDCRYTTAVTAWTQRLDSAGTSLPAAFTNFTRWNYFTGSRSIGNHFADGDDYPLVAIMRYHDTIPDSNRSSSTPPQPLASNYIVFDNFLGYTGTLTFDFTGVINTNWGLSYMIDYGSGQVTEVSLPVLQQGKVKVHVPKIEEVLRVVYIPAVTSHFGTSFNYTYHLYFRLRGDLDDNNLITVSDAVYGINYIFGGGPAPNPPDVMDVDCNGINTVSDIVMLVNYIFGGGSLDCD